MTGLNSLHLTLLRGLVFAFLVGLILLPVKWSSALQTSSGVQKTIPTVPDPKPVASGDLDTSSTFRAMAQRISNVRTAYQEQALEPVVDQQVWLTAASSFYECAMSVNERRAYSPGWKRLLRKEAAQLMSPTDASRWLNKHWKLSGIDRIVSSSEENRKAIEDRVIHAMLYRLSPQSQYVSAKENRVNKQLAENQYVGIGIQVSFNKNLVMISEPFVGGAAYKAGAKKNDYITQVNGESMTGLNLGQVVDKLRGVRGSHVSVEVKNSDGSEARLLKMTRDVIPIPSVKGYAQENNGSWNFVKQNLSPKETENDSTIGYMQIDSIVGSTAAELRQAARQLVNADAKGAILDLRNLQDSSLHHLTMVCDVLMQKQTLGYLTNNNGEARKLTTTGDSDFSGLPLVVLVRGGNVSGPVMAALTALKQRPATYLIGQATQSSGVCLERVDLPDNDGAIANLPYAKLTPNSASKQGTRTNMLGESLQGPDSMFKLVPDESIDNQENSLGKAYEFFNQTTKPSQPTG